MKVGALYYPTGELYFIGRYDETAMDDKGIPYKLLAGVMFYKDGTVYQEGIFQWGGLYYGRVFYPFGKLKFIGQFNDKHGAVTGQPAEEYYGPSYPVEGTFYSEDGTIIYQGKFQIRKQGSLGYPKVIVPEEFGPLT